MGSDFVGDVPLSKKILAALTTGEDGLNLLPCGTVFLESTIACLWLQYLFLAFMPVFLVESDRKISKYQDLEFLKYQIITITVNKPSIKKKNWPINS